MYKQLMGKYLDKEHVVRGQLFGLFSVGREDIPCIPVVLMHSIVELLHIDRAGLIFQDIPEGSHSIALTGEFFVAREEYDYHLIVDISQEFRGLKSVQTRHFNIEYDDSVLTLCEVGEQLLSAAEFIKGVFVLM